MDDIFLKLEGIQGEAQDSVYKDEIDVFAWSWGMHQSGTTHMGPGGGGGKVSVSDITVTKNVDKATPNIIKYCCSGDHIPTAKLIVRKAGGSPVEYYTLDMKQVIISSYNTGGSKDGLDRVQETLTLNFREFEMNYTEQNADGTAGPSTPAAFNIAENEAPS